MKVNQGACTRVDRERWVAAQAWEREHWSHVEQLRAKYGKTHLWRLLSWLRLKPKHRGDDHNAWWKSQLDQYSFLPARVENAIELGCGPYTNMRLILPVCHPEHLVLSDPLIRTYIRFPLGFVADIHRRGFFTLDDHPIENCPFAPDFFDLVIMINVLDHVRDAGVCLQTAMRITKPGGVLIIGQDLSNEQDAIAMQDDPGQVGHPIRVDHEWMDSYLKDWTPIIKKVLTREQGRAPAYHYGTYVFAGHKNS